MMLSTKSNHYNSKTHSDICSKNHRNISDEMGIEKFLLDNSKGAINNCDIGKVDDKVTGIEEIHQSTPITAKVKVIVRIATKATVTVIK